MKKKFIPKLKAPKRKAKKTINVKDAAVAAADLRAKEHKNIDRKFRQEFQEFTGKGTDSLKALAAHKPKDWAFKTKKEGRPSLVGPKKVNVKLKKEVWTQAVLCQVFRKQDINVGSGECRWFVSFDNPSRKATGQDQLDVMMMPADTFFTVKHNFLKKWLVIEDKGGTIL